MGLFNKTCPECDDEIADDQIYVVAEDEHGDYGERGELFPFHPKCWADGECLSQLKEHTNWVISLAAATLKTLRTEYHDDIVPEIAADYMPELDHALAELLEEVRLLRTLGEIYQEKKHEPTA